MNLEFTLAHLCASYCLQCVHHSLNVHPIVLKVSIKVIAISKVHNNPLVYILLSSMCPSSLKCTSHYPKVVHQYPFSLLNWWDSILLFIKNPSNFNISAIYFTLVVNSDGFTFKKKSLSIIKFVFVNAQFLHQLSIGVH